MIDPSDRLPCHDAHGITGARWGDASTQPRINVLRTVWEGDYDENTGFTPENELKDCMRRH